jgi:hypothetical protein
MHPGAVTRAARQQAESAAALRGKKSPAIWRGKTDSLEISQRGKSCIYTKFIIGCKRKMNKNWALIECNICIIIGNGRQV